MTYHTWIFPINSQIFLHSKINKNEVSKIKGDIFRYHAYYFISGLIFIERCWSEYDYWEIVKKKKIKKKKKFYINKLF